MITLTFLLFIYTIFGYLRHYSLYKTTDIFSQPPRVWTVILLTTTIISILVILYLIFKYLP